MTIIKKRKRGGIMYFRLFIISMLCAVGSLALPSRANASARCYDTQPVLAWNGTTDDSSALVTAINAAIAQAGNGAACVQLPVGTGVLCQVNLPSFPNGLRLIGAGIGATLIKPCTSTSTIFVTTGTSSTFFDTGHYTISRGIQQTNGLMFSISNVQNVNIHDISARLGYNFAYFDSLTNVGICDTDIRTFKGTVFIVNGGFDYRWCSRNNYDDDNLATGQVSAYILVRKVGGLVIDAVDAIHCGSCFVFNPQFPGDIIEWVFINQAQADTCSGTGWLLNAPAGTTIKGFQAQGLWGSSCGTFGFRTEGSGTIDGVNLTNPRILGNGQDGISLGSGVNIDITSPIVAGNSATSPGVYSGVSFGPAVNAFSVTGGKVGATAALPASQRYNVLIQSGSGKVFNITGVNVCSFASGGAGILDVSGPGTKMIRNNLCHNTPDP